MKKIFLAFLLLSASAALFAERVTFTTGNMAGNSLTDSFMPVDFGMMGSHCTVSAVRRIEGNLWCLALTAAKTSAASACPVVYEYYLKTGDSIRLRRLNAQAGGMSECTLTAVSLDWNRAVFELE